MLSIHHCVLLDLFPSFELLGLRFLVFRIPCYPCGMGGNDPLYFPFKGEAQGYSCELWSLLTLSLPLYPFI